MTDEMERLSFKNRHVATLSQEINYVEGEGNCLAPQSVVEGDNVIILRMTLDEWKKVWASVYTGADICYPFESDNVRWSLIRNLECPVNICEMIIDCITNDAATQDAIIDMLLDSERFTETMQERLGGNNQGAIGAGLYGPDCTNGVVAGRVIQLVDRLDTNNQDFFEILEVGTNDEERVASIIGAIPAIGILPIDEIFDMFQLLLENIAENYNAAVTAEWKDSVAEGLYCLAKEKEGCVLTYGDVFEYFVGRAGAELTLSSLLRNVVDYVLLGDFTTDELIASGMMVIQLGFVMTGSEFNGMNIPKIGSLMRDAPPSTQWEEWEECGPEAERTPIIDSEWDAPNIAGTLSGPTAEGVWTVTSGTRASDEAFSIRDVSGRPFVLVDHVYSAGPQCQVWLLDGVLEHLACGVGDQYVGETVDEFWTTWFSGPHQTMQFKMQAPPTP